VPRSAHRPRALPRARPQRRDRRAGALADDAFRLRYAERTGADESNLLEKAVATVTRDVERLRSAPAISPRVTVSGHVYDVVTGLVETVLST
jgi:carbonic anhydrase